jgi:hypothetical protein
MEFVNLTNVRLFELTTGYANDPNRTLAEPRIALDDTQWSHDSRLRQDSAALVARHVAQPGG